MIKKILLLLVFISAGISAQTLTFDEFVTRSKPYLRVEHLDDIKQHLASAQFSITALDYGDFTGDGKNDFALGIRPRGRRDKAIFIYLFVDSLDAYTPVLRDTLNFYELPIEIGFSINNNACYVTHKIDDRNWTITGYSFNRNEYSLVDVYKTDKMTIGKNFQIGKEDYNNYRDLSASAGFFNLNTLLDYKKSRFFIHPVYDLRRNIYKSYPRAVIINETWEWGDTLTPKNNYGEFEVGKDSSYLIFDFTIAKALFDRLSRTGTNTITIYFDRSTERLSKNVVRRSPVFRSGLSEETGSLTVSFNASYPLIPKVVHNFSSSYNPEKTRDIQAEATENELLRIKVPIGLLNLPEGQNQAGLFVQMDLAMIDGSKLTLRNSSGSYDDPSTYGRMLFIDKDEFYGKVVNEKFSELLDMLERNGLITRSKGF